MERPLKKKQVIGARAIVILVEFTTTKYEKGPRVSFIGGPRDLYFGATNNYKSITIHYTTSEFKYVVNRRGEAESINCIFKLASGVVILSRAAKPKKEKKTAISFHGEFRAVVYQIDNHHMWIKFQVN